MPQVRCQIVRWVADDPQPGLVEAQIIDVDGHVWGFVDKTAIFSAEVLFPTSSYPVRGVIRCEIVSRSGEVVTIDTGRPDGVESAGQTTFRMASSEITP